MSKWYLVRVQNCIPFQTNFRDTFCKKNGKYLETLLFFVISRNTISFIFLAKIEYMDQPSVIQGSDTKKMTKQCIFLFKFKRGSKPFDDSLSALNFSSDFKPMLRSTDLHLLLFALNVLQIRQHRWCLTISRYQFWHLIKRHGLNNFF